MDNQMGQDPKSEGREPESRVSEPQKPAMTGAPGPNPQPTPQMAQPTPPMPMPPASPSPMAPQPQPFMSSPASGPMPNQMNQMPNPMASQQRPPAPGPVGPTPNQPQQPMSRPQPPPSQGMGATAAGQPMMRPRPIMTETTPVPAPASILSTELHENEAPHPPPGLFNTRPESRVETRSTGFSLSRPETEKVEAKKPEPAPARKLEAKPEMPKTRTETRNLESKSESSDDVMPGGGFKKRMRRMRLRPGMHIYVLPNLITTMNMFFGFVAIIQAIKGEYVFSAYAIVAAAIFDQLDGRVARLTHSSSKFGAEYDSLCDLISFGAAPSIILYLWALQPFGRIGWLVSFLFTACGALRLARFNVQANVIEKAYFQGLPIPMAAGIVASSVLAFTDLELDAQRSYLLLFMTVLLSIVMVSTFRYRSFKDIDLKRRLPFKYLVIGVALLALVAIKPEVMLFVVFLSYAVAGAVFGILGWGKNPKIATSPTGPVFADDSGDDLHEEVEDDEEPAK